MMNDHHIIEVDFLEHNMSVWLAFIVQLPSGYRTPKFTLSFLCVEDNVL